MHEIIYRVEPSEYVLTLLGGNLRLPSVLILSNRRRGNIGKVGVQLAQDLPHPHPHLLIWIQHQAWSLCSSGRICKPGEQIGQHYLSSSKQWVHEYQYLKFVQSSDLLHDKNSFNV